MQIKLGKINAVVKGLATKLNQNNRLKRTAFGVTLFVTMLSTSVCAKKLSDALTTLGYIQEQIIEKETELLDITHGYALTNLDGAIDGYDIDFTPIELQGILNNYKYDVYKKNQSGTGKLIREDVPCGQTIMVTDPGDYYAKIYDMSNKEEYGTTKVVRTQTLKSGIGFIKQENELLEAPRGYVRVDESQNIIEYDIDFTPIALHTDENAKNYICIVFKKDENGNGIPIPTNNIPCGEVITIKEPGEYYARIIDISTGKEIGYTDTINTNTLHDGMGIITGEDQVFINQGIKR